MYFIDKTGRRDHRAADKAVAKRGLRSTNRRERELAREAGERISKESGKVKSMRESLVKAHREGNHEEIKDVHEVIKNNPEYQNK